VSHFWGAVHGAAILFLLIGWGAYALYMKYVAESPAVISLSAYFVDDAGRPAASEDASKAR